MYPKYKVGEVVVFNSGSIPLTILGSKWNQKTGLFDYELIYFKTNRKNALVKTYWNYQPDSNMILIPEPAITKANKRRL